MSRYIDEAELLINLAHKPRYSSATIGEAIDESAHIDIVFCQDCRKSHIDGKTTHYLWCSEWGRSTDTFGHCERGEREGE